MHIVFLASHLYLLYCDFQRQVIARIVDGSRFDEFKALYGETLVTGKPKHSSVSPFQAHIPDFVAAVEKLVLADLFIE